MVVEIKSVEEFDSYIKNNQKCVVDFWAEWCVPCKTFTPVFESISSSYQNMVFLKVNVEKFQQISSKYFVTSLPAIFFFINGAVMKQIIGNADKNKIISILNKEMA